MALIAIADTTVLVHLNNKFTAMSAIIKQNNISILFTTRINYLENLAGASEKSKRDTLKFLAPFKLLEFDPAAVMVANKLAKKYRISKNKTTDFLIATIAITNNLPLLTENTKDFPYKEIKLLPYSIKDL